MFAFGGQIQFNTGRINLCSRARDISSINNVLITRIMEDCMNKQRLNSRNTISGLSNLNCIFSFSFIIYEYSTSYIIRKSDLLCSCVKSKLTFACNSRYFISLTESIIIIDNLYILNFCTSSTYRNILQNYSMISTDCQSL